jgi:hypothetical protein
MKTFHEAPDIEGPAIQHAVTPGEEVLAAAFAGPFDHRVSVAIRRPNNMVMLMRRFS